MINVSRKRSITRYTDEAKIHNLVVQGQLDLSQIYDDKYMSNAARNWLDWSPGRFKAAVERYVERRKQAQNKIRNARKVSGGK